MGSLYPTNLDGFRSHVAGFDRMISSDLVDLFDVAIAIEIELGINPAGVNGTLYGRLFGTGNLSDVNPGWRRLKWGQTFPQGSSFARSLFEGSEVSWSASFFAGRDTVFGDDTPAPFGALQGPVSTFGPTLRKGVPWRSALNVVEPDRATWYGQDGDGTPELGPGNTSALTWGYLTWSLFTGG